ncbi:MAG: hypothetical protein K8I60_19980, partial [Anaerolineae bacterium]|nr:hypothetical protein [Anaerolineae bacterium]
PFVTHFPPEQIHHLLAFATLYIGEGGTMLTEAAILGTPALFASSLQAGNWFDLRDHYGLLYFYDNGTAAQEKAHELLSNPHLKQEWAERRARLLQEKIDPTPWFVDLGNRLIQNPHDRPE